MAYVMGIDVGTTGTRAIIVRPDGHVVGAATGDHQPMLMLKPGWAEQEPVDWWEATIKAVRTALEAAGLKGEDIAAIGLSGQMHGVVLLDKTNAVLRPSLIWCDQRSQAQCDWITRKVGAERLIQLVSNPALTGFSAPKMLWVRDNEPQIFERAVHFLLPKDYVRLRLTGEFATEVSDASGTLLLDVTNRRWSKEMLSALGIDSSILPRVYESPEITGQITQETALATGLKAGTPVVGGGGDQAASAVGNGIVSPGLTSATLGTSGVVFAYTDAPKLDPRGRIHTFCHAVPGKWHVMGVTQGAGLSLQWFRNRLAPGTDYDHLTAEAAQASPGCEGLYWLPYLMGERTPHLDANARGGWIGLTAKHTRADLVRAILEGVSYSLKDCLEIIEELKVSIKAVRASGGGARSGFWRQLLADVFAKPVTTLETQEGSAYGVALLAMVGTGRFKTVPEACAATVREVTRTEPNREATAAYAQRYPIFRSLYPALRGAAF